MKKNKSKVFFIIPMLVLIVGLFIGYMLYHFNSIKGEFDLGLSVNIAAFAIVEIINVFLLFLFIFKKDLFGFKTSLLFIILYFGVLFVFPIYQASSSLEDSKTHEMSVKQNYYNAYGVSIDNLISMWE